MADLTKPGADAAGTLANEDESTHGYLIYLITTAFAAVTFIVVAATCCYCCIQRRKKNRQLNDLKETDAESDIRNDTRDFNISVVQKTFVESLQKSLELITPSGKNQQYEYTSINQTDEQIDLTRDGVSSPGVESSPLDDGGFDDSFAEKANLLPPKRRRLQEDDSLQKVYPKIDANDKDHGLGRLQVKVQYLLQRRALKVDIVSANNLSAMDISGTSDPFVKVTLLPEQTSNSTRYIKETLNPLWNEEFYFKKIQIEALLTKTLHFRVYDFDRFRKDDCIGELFVELNKYGVLQLQDSVTIDKFISPALQTGRVKGKILVSLKYQQETERLVVAILRCEDLNLRGINHPYCYVKVTMLDKKRKVSKQMTASVKPSKPIFNEAFEFDVENCNLRDITFVIKLVDGGRKNNTLVGFTDIGQKSGSKAVQHLKEVIRLSGKNVAEWYNLRLK